MKLNKVIIGFVTQTFDTEKGVFTGQEFTASDEVTIEDENGMTVNCGESKEADEKFFNAPDGQPYLNMEMIQPEVESPAVF